MSSGKVKRPILTVTISNSVFEDIEKERGIISRSAYVEYLIKKSLYGDINAGQE